MLAAVAALSTLLFGITLGGRGLRKRRVQDGPAPNAVDWPEHTDGPNTQNGDAPELGAAGAAQAKHPGGPATAEPATPVPPPAGPPRVYTPTQDVLPGRPLVRHPVGTLQPASASPPPPAAAPGGTETAQPRSQTAVPTEQRSPTTPPGQHPGVSGQASPPAPAFPGVAPPPPSERAASGASDDGGRARATASMALGELSRLFGSSSRAEPGPAPHPPREESSEESADR